MHSQQWKSCCVNQLVKTDLWLYKSKVMTIWNVMNSKNYKNIGKTRLGLKCQTPVKVKPLPLPV